MAKGDGAGIYGATIRIKKYEYRIRRGGKEEPYFVVEPVGKHQSIPLQEAMQRYANLDHSELKGYVPHEPAVVAQVLAKRLGARILNIEMPEPPPEGWEPDPNIVA